jgi:hypothetical protein
MVGLLRKSRNVDKHIPIAKRLVHTPTLAVPCLTQSQAAKNRNSGIASTRTTTPVRKTVSFGSLHLDGRDNHAQHLVLFFAHRSQHAVTLSGKKRHAVNLDNGVT